MAEAAKRKIRSFVILDPVNRDPLSSLKSKVRKRCTKNLDDAPRTNTPSTFQILVDSNPDLAGSSFEDRAQGPEGTRRNAKTVERGYSAEGGAVDGGCSGWGVVLYSKTAYNRM